jgi:hypothetical protein
VVRAARSGQTAQAVEVASAGLRPLLCHRPQTPATDRPPPRGCLSRRGASCLRALQRSGSRCQPVRLGMRPVAAKPGISRCQPAPGDRCPQSGRRKGSRSRERRRAVPSVVVPCQLRPLQRVPVTVALRDIFASASWHRQRGSSVTRRAQLPSHRNAGTLRAGAGCRAGLHIRSACLALPAGPPTTVCCWLADPGPWWRRPVLLPYRVGALTGSWRQFNWISLTGCFYASLS